MNIFTILLTLIYLGVALSSERKNTVLVGEGIEKDGFLLLFCNSSSLVDHVSFHGKSEEHALSISENSHLSVEFCAIVVEDTSYIPFVCSGYILIKGIELAAKENGEVSIPTLCLNNKDNQLHSGSFVLNDCKFKGCVMVSHRGSFVSSGEAVEQAVKNCEFLNISMKKKGKESENIISSQVMKSLLHSVRIEDSQDSFYGVIVSGLTGKTVGEFACTNNTFINIRRDIIRYNNNNKNNNNNNKSMIEGIEDKGSITYKNSKFNNINRKYEDNKKRQIVISKSYQFNYNSFIDCQTSSGIDPNMIDKNGGAICGACMDDEYNLLSTCSSSSIDVTNCYFNNCWAYENGGGICIYNIKTAISQCTFEHCRSSYNSPYGGGVCIFNCYCTSIRLCLFKNCSSYQGGGLLALLNYSYSVISTCESTYYSTIYGCNFYNCNTDKVDSYEKDLGGGGVYVDFYTEQCINDCLFQYCSTNGFGGGLFMYMKDYIPNSIKYCTFKVNYALGKGHDISFVYNNKTLVNPIAYTTITDSDSYCCSIYYSTTRSTYVDDWLKEGDSYTTNRTYGSSFTGGVDDDDDDEGGGISVDKDSSKSTGSGMPWYVIFIIVVVCYGVVFFAIFLSVLLCMKRMLNKREKKLLDNYKNVNMEEEEEGENRQ